MNAHDRLRAALPTLRGEAKDLYRSSQRGARVEFDYQVAVLEVLAAAARGDQKGRVVAEQNALPLADQVEAWRAEAPLLVQSFDQWWSRVDQLMKDLAKDLITENS